MEPNGGRAGRRELASTCSGFCPEVDRGGRGGDQRPRVRGRESQAVTTRPTSAMLAPEQFSGRSCGVPVRIVEVDDVDRRNTPVVEREVIVHHARPTRALNEVAFNCRATVQISLTSLRARSRLCGSCLDFRDSCPHHIEHETGFVVEIGLGGPQPLST